MCTDVCKKNKAVFLDRDGVLNHSIVRNGRPYAPVKLEEFKLIEEAKEALKMLKSHKFLTIVVSNQPDVGRGIIKKTTLGSMHKILRENLEIDDLYTCECTHSCPFYKPNPGMLLKAAKKWGIDLTASYMVGDRWRDIDAGTSAGCQTVFIDYSYEETLRQRPTKIVNSVLDACEWICSKS